MYCFSSHSDNFIYFFITCIFQIQFKLDKTSLFVVYTLLKETKKSPTDLLVVRLIYFTMY